MICWLLAVALGGSLDVIEVGGPWGSPGATNATATWWNPAALSIEQGTGFVLEAAPTFAGVTYERTNPDYGPPQDVDEDGEPDPYDYGGTDEIGFVGVLPFAGIRSDLGVRGLGVGLALAVPYGRGAKELDEPGPGSFHMRQGRLAAAHVLAAASWRFGERFAIGVSGAYVASTWGATVDAETLSVLQDNAGGLIDQPDQRMEDRDYAGTLVFEDLKDHGFTGGAGLYWTPSDRVGLSVAWIHGVKLAHTGTIRLRTGCPPESDMFTRAAIEGLGLCNADVPGTGGIAYDLPDRVHAGLVLRPADRWRLETMGGWVGWKVFDAYQIDAVIPPESLKDALNPEEASRRLEQHRPWARNSKNSLWAGLDAKWEAADKVELGSRVLYDGPAIPLNAISSNNYDTPMVGLTLAGLFGPFGPIRPGLSVEQFLMAPREVDDSIFAVTLDPDRNPTRTFYPSAAGTYTGRITRLGVALHGGF